ncbi:MAG: CCA tRNA nucleotidyltransferase [Solobacterium sp.]|nr:CCA tRNA nucleotidyltransferase [Solobacterium sp.]
MKKSMPLPPYIKNTIFALNEAGYEAYVVGGAVRSWLLGTEIHDYDITSNALPQEIREVLHQYKVIDTGIKHGTVTVIEHKNPVEITTYRTESGYRDHRHPDVVTFTRSLEEDCARRDFTINALCYHPKEGIKDFFGGIQDLQNFLIRAVGNPEERFQEDALRILRAIRFSAQLGFQIEDSTKDALFAQMDTLSYVSQERITSELLKTARAPYFSGIFIDYIDLFRLLIPELQEYDDTCIQNIRASLSRSPSDADIRLAIVLSELHDPVRCDEILRRLKLSNQERYAIVNLLENGDLPLENRIDMRKAMNRLTVAVPMYLNFRSALDPTLDKEALNQLFQQIVKDKDCYSFKQLEVTGRDLQSLGLKGSAISMSMNTCLLAVMEEKLPNKKEDLMNYLKELTGQFN